MNPFEMRKQFNEVGLSSLINISDVGTKYSKSYLEDNNYNFIIDKVTFESLFPYCSSDNVYIQKNSFMPIYYDESRLLYRDIPIILATDGGYTIFIPSEDKESELRKLFDFLDNYKMGSDFIKTIAFQSDKVALDLFIKAIKYIESDELYDLFEHMYTTYDYGFSSISKEDLLYLCSLKTIEKQALLNKKLNSFDGDYITLYRGEGDKSTGYKEAYSWTSDLSVAYKFAVGYSNDTAKILKSKVSKDKILDYFDSREEEEFLVLGEDIQNVEYIYLPSLIYDINDDCRSYVLNNLKKYSRMFPFHMFNYNHSEAHSREHLVRVAFLSLMIIYNLKEKLDYSVKESDLKRLVIASLFHDSDDGYINCQNGLKSYMELVDLGVTEEDDILKILIGYYHKDDMDFYNKISEEVLSDTDKDILFLLYRVIKDADTLDRIRFGLGELDVKSLKLDESIKFTLIAKQLLNVDVLFE